MRRFQEIQRSCQSASTGANQIVRMAAVLIAIVAMPAVSAAQTAWDSPPQNLPSQAPPPDTLSIELPPATPSFNASTTPQTPIQDHSVQHANFDANIDEIPDIHPREGSMMSAVENTAKQQMTGLMKAIQSPDGIGSKIQETFSRVDIKKVFGSLAIVLGVYFGIVWMLRKVQGGPAGGLPKEVVEVLGQAPFGTKQNLQLVRLGSKLLLLLRGPDSVTTIGEINNPDEVDYLASVCTGKPRSAPRNRRALRTESSTVPPAEMTIPAKDLESVIRGMVQASKQGSGSVFEA